MMTTPQMLVLAALSRERLTTILRCLGAEPCRGRPWSASRRQRVLLACAALRTNLTIRELAATFGVSRSAAHRVIASSRQ
jgi:DNA-binding MarR family transcriptional regulator